MLLKNRSIFVIHWFNRRFLIDLIGNPIQRENQTAGPIRVLKHWMFPLNQVFTHGFTRGITWDRKVEIDVSMITFSPCRGRQLSLSHH